MFVQVVTVVVFYVRLEMELVTVHNVWIMLDLSMDNAHVRLSCHQTTKHFTSLFSLSNFLNINVTLSDSVCRLEATNTGFCWLLTSVTRHVIHVTQTVIGPMQASTVGGVSLRLRWNNRLKFVPINV